jgi:hypothetical protein
VPRNAPTALVSGDPAFPALVHRIARLRVYRRHAQGTASAKLTAALDAAQACQHGSGLVDNRSSAPRARRPSLWKLDGTVPTRGARGAGARAGNGGAPSHPRDAPFIRRPGARGGRRPRTASAKGRPEKKFCNSASTLSTRVSMPGPRPLLSRTLRDLPKISKNSWPVVRLRHAQCH